MATVRAAQSLETHLERCQGTKSKVHWPGQGDRQAVKLICFKRPDEAGPTLWCAEGSPSWLLMVSSCTTIALSATKLFHSHSSVDPWTSVATKLIICPAAAPPSQCLISLPSPGPSRLGSLHATTFSNKCSDLHCSRTDRQEGNGARKNNKEQTLA